MNVTACKRQGWSFGTEDDAYVLSGCIFRDITHTHPLLQWLRRIYKCTHTLVCALHCACEITPLYCSHHHHPHPTCSSRDAFCSFTLRRETSWAHTGFTVKKQRVGSKPSKQKVNPDLYVLNERPAGFLSGCNIDVSLESQECEKSLFFSTLWDGRIFFVSFYFVEFIWKWKEHI